MGGEARSPVAGDDRALVRRKGPAEEALGKGGARFRVRRGRADKAARALRRRGELEADGEGGELSLARKGAQIGADPGGSVAVGGGGGGDLLPVREEEGQGRDRREGVSVRVLREEERLGVVEVGGVAVDAPADVLSVAPVGEGEVVLLPAPQEGGVRCGEIVYAPEGGVRAGGEGGEREESAEKEQRAEETRAFAFFRFFCAGSGCHDVPFGCRPASGRSFCCFCLPV